MSLIHAGEHLARGARRTKAGSRDLPAKHNDTRGVYQVSSSGTIDPRITRAVWYGDRMNRNTLILIGACLFLSGCELTTKSPFSGKDVSAEDLAVEIQAKQVEIQTQQEKVKKEAEAKISEVASANARAKALFAKAVGRVESDAKSQIDLLTAEFDQNALEAEAIQNRIISDTKAAIADLDARRFAAETSAKAAIERLEAKQERFQALISAAQVLSEGFGGPIGGVASALLGAGGMVFGIAKRRDAVAAKEAATRIVDAIDVLKTKRPEVAQAFKDEAKTVSEWLGPKAIEFVSKVQQS